MIGRTCEFETSRLRVGEWHSVPLRPGRDLAVVVTEMLTDGTTRSLPSAWHGAYTPERAQAWIAERDEESATLLATGRESGEPLGLVILFELAADDQPDDLDLRLGYLLAEPAWGRGLASELIEGLVSWCRSQPSIRSIAAGVATDNVASARVLTNNGFAPVGHPDHGEQIYELSLRS